MKRWPLYVPGAAVVVAAVALVLVWFLPWYVTTPMSLVAVAVAVVSLIRSERTIRKLRRGDRS